MERTNGVDFVECLFSVTTTERDKIPVLGYKCGLLGYHQANLSGYSCEQDGQPGYAIDHIPTGARIVWVKREREARQFISEARQLDWDFDSREEGKKNLFACLKILDGLGRQ